MKIRVCDISCPFSPSSPSCPSCASSPSSPSSPSFAFDPPTCPDPPWQRHTLCQYQPSVPGHRAHRKTEELTCPDPAPCHSHSLCPWLKSGRGFRRSRGPSFQFAVTLDEENFYNRLPQSPKSQIPRQGWMMPRREVRSRGGAGRGG
eukprot:1574524-Rhodomonas_salina.1